MRFRGIFSDKLYNGWASIEYWIKKALACCNSVSERVTALEILNGMLSPAIINFIAALPYSGTEGDAYILTTNNHYYLWNDTTSTWDEIIPRDGQTVINKADDQIYIFDGTNWILSADEPMWRVGTGLESIEQVNTLHPNEATGAYAIATGADSLASRYAEQAQSAGKIVATGDAQSIRVPMKLVTLDATAQKMTLGDGTALILPADTAWTYEIQVTGMDTTTGKTIGFTETGLVRRTGTGVPVIVTNPAGPTTTTWKDTTIAATVVVAAGGVNTLDITVQNSFAIPSPTNWTATVLLTQIQFAAVIPPVPPPQYDLGVALVDTSVAGGTFTVTNPGLSIPTGDISGGAIVNPGNITWGTGSYTGPDAGMTAAVLALYNQLHALIATHPVDLSTGNIGDTNIGFGLGVFIPGVYKATAAVSVVAGKTITLDGAGDYVFDIADALTFGAGVTMVLINGAVPSRVFFVVGTVTVGSSITTGATCVLSGNFILGNAGVALTIGSTNTLEGRILATSTEVVVVDGTASVMQIPLT